MIITCCDFFQITAQDLNAFQQAKIKADSLTRNIDSLIIPEVKILDGRCGDGDFQCIVYHVKNNESQKVKFEFKDAQLSPITFYHYQSHLIKVDLQDSTLYFVEGKLVTKDGNVKPAISLNLS